MNSYLLAFLIGIAVGALVILEGAQGRSTVDKDVVQMCTGQGGIYVDAEGFAAGGKRVRFLCIRPDALMGVE